MLATRTALPIKGLLTLIALLPAAGQAAEGFRLRTPPLGLLGPEMASPLRTPGFFATGVLSQAEIKRIVDDQGNTLTVPARAVPLPTGTPTGGAIRDGTYTLQIPAGAVNLKQSQTQLNLVAGYLTAPVYAGGSLVARASLPFTTISRSFQATQPAGTIVPTPGAPLPPAAIGAVNAVAAAVNTQVQTALAASGNMHNVDVDGVGDLELAAAWLGGTDRVRMTAGLSVHLPTGKYDAARGPNPGLGDFRTVQFGVGAVHSPIPGLVFGLRASVGSNSTNRDTSYRSGNFYVLEGSAMKDWGRVALGMSLLTIRQSSDDTLRGASVAAMRYRNNAVAPFVTWRPEGSPVAFTLQFAHSFGGRSAQEMQSAQLRLVRTL